MSHCRTGSTCNYPEGECVGLCLHRITVTTTNDLSTEAGYVQIEATDDGQVTATYVKGSLPIEYAEPEPSTLTHAWDAYTTHRPRGRMKALIHAWKRLVRAFRTRHIPDPFKEQA